MVSSAWWIWLAIEASDRVMQAFAHLGAANTVIKFETGSLYVDRVSMSGGPPQLLFVAKQ